MYSSYFGLKEMPFQLTPDPAFLFLSRAHRRTLTYLNYGLTEQAGFILVTGEVGTGKTTVIRSLMKGLKEDIRLARINNTRVTSDQLISMINEDFGLATKGRDKTGMLSDLADFLIQQYAQGRRSLLIIDEAQNLMPDLLEEIRLLSNLETERSKLLQIILVGQPELRAVLARPDLRQLRQRISISCHIQPLTREETEEYIFHRLEVAGNRKAIAFDAGSIDAVHAFSRGIPRLVNIACDFLLLSAFVDDKREIDEDLAGEVIAELETDNKYWHDETPKVPPGNGTEIMKDILSRLDKLEVTSYKRDITQAEKRDIHERLSALEKQLSSTVYRLKTGLVDHDTEQRNDRLRNLLDEIGALKLKVAELEKGSHPESRMNNKKKRTFWNRIFA